MSCYNTTTFVSVDENVSGRVYGNTEAGSLWVGVSPATVKWHLREVIADTSSFSAWYAAAERQL